MLHRGRIGSEVGLVSLNIGEIVPNSLRKWLTYKVAGTLRHIILRRVGVQCGGVRRDSKVQRCGSCEFKSPIQSNFHKRRSIGQGL